MLCCVAECGREAMYTAAKLCQMHYFRHRRTGSFDLEPKQRIERRSNAKGYQLVLDTKHPLAMSDGYVYEHRRIVFERYGHDLPPCEVCGATTSWETCHIDHRDEVITNNDPANLRPLCCGCNTSRTEKSTIVKYEHDGKVLSLTEWAKQPGVTVGRRQLQLRIRSGMSIGDALFAKNVTHPKALFTAKLKELKA